VDGQTDTRGQPYVQRIHTKEKKKNCIKWKFVSYTILLILISHQCYITSAVVKEMLNNLQICHLDH
jgi:lantibiotic modifying enzyme